MLFKNKQFTILFFIIIIMSQNIAIDLQERNGEVAAVKEEEDTTEEERPINYDIINDDTADGIDDINPDEYEEIRTDIGVPQILKVPKFLANIHLHQEHVCSGAYIEPVWVVTAASCLSEAAEAYSVIMGSVVANGSAGQKRSILHLYPHAQHRNSTLKYDIALIKLTSPFDTGLYIQMIKLAKEVQYDATECNVMGWGLTSNNSIESIDPTAQAESLNLNIITGKECNDNYAEYNMSIESSIVCARSNTDICMVDSGAPLTCQSRLMGIIYATSYCGGNSPSLFSSIPFYYHWINNYITSSDFTLRSNGDSLDLIKLETILIVTIVFHVCKKIKSCM